MQIYNGRQSFCQWDLNQKLIVSEHCEVHFCNGTSDCSLVCETYEEDGKILVNVPNILLQTAKNIRAYQYIEENGEQYTKDVKVFSVQARTKPDDYVYTETEVKNIETVVNDALLKAKESGEFDGEDGKDGKDGANGKDGKDGRGIVDIGYNKNRGMWYVRYTDNKYQYFSGINPLTGEFVFVDDNFSYTYSDDIERYTPYRYYGNTKTAYINNALHMSAVGSSKNTTDSVGVYHDDATIMGECVIEFDFTPTLATGKNTPFLEVRLFDNQIWARINRVGLNWWCVSTSSGLDIPSTPTAERLKFNYEIGVTYRIKIMIKRGSVRLKSWKVGEDEPLTDNDNTVDIMSNLIDDNLLSVEYSPIIFFGQINDISNPTAQFKCKIDNYKIYKE